MTRNSAFFMHQRAVQIVQQQQRAAGSPSPPFSFTDPTFGGLVSVIIDDGSGGKFVGGSFTSVTCNVTSTTYTTGYTRLVHLLPTGEVDSLWSCPVGSSQVHALALDVANDRLFVGGNFTSIGGESRTDLAMVEASSGDVDIGWTCNVIGLVYALALDVANDRLFVGGQISSIGGELRDDLALVEASSGTVDIGWTCNVTSFASFVVRALALDVANDRLFVGGDFTGIGGQPRTDLALVEASSGTVNIGWVCNTGNSFAKVLSDPTNDALFVFGGFSGATGLDGQQRDRFGTVVASTGDLHVP